MDRSKQKHATRSAKDIGVPCVFLCSSIAGGADDGRRGIACFAACGCLLWGGNKGKRVCVCVVVCCAAFFSTPDGLHHFMLSQTETEGVRAQSQGVFQASTTRARANRRRASMKEEQKAEHASPVGGKKNERKRMHERSNETNKRH